MNERIKEFRLGNYIKRAKHKNLSKFYHGEIIEIGYSELYLMSIGTTHGWYEPIEITEDILFKFGFFKYNKAYMLENPNYQTKFLFSIWEDLTYNTGEINPPLKYVHQLQNLYFALTGEELVFSTEP